jgi:hypothetical protein
MKQEVLQRTTAHSNFARKLQERETLLHKFTYWFKDFIESAE